MHKNLVKIGRVVPDICSRTDTQTDTLIAILCHPSRGKLIKMYYMMESD